MTQLEDRLLNICKVTQDLHPQEEQSTMPPLEGVVPPSIVHTALADREQISSEEDLESSYHPPRRKPSRNRSRRVGGSVMGPRQTFSDSKDDSTHVKNLTIIPLPKFKLTPLGQYNGCADLEDHMIVDDDLLSPKDEASQPSFTKKAEKGIWDHKKLKRPRTYPPSRRYTQLTLPIIEILNHIQEQEPQLPPGHL